MSIRFRTAALYAGLLALGSGIGATAVHMTRPVAMMAPVRPVPIAKLPEASLWPGDAIVTVRGRVADIYGNRFVLSDGSGRALIDTGRGEGGGIPIASGQTVTVQGRVDNGAIRADFLVDADGHVVALDRHGRRHDHDHDRGHGRHDGRGPDRDAGPVAPPPAPGA